MGYEDLYEVSNHGRVRSLHRWAAKGDATSIKAKRLVKGRVLRPGVSRGRYLVALYKDGIKRSARVHLLVLEAFAGPRPEGMHGCHGRAGPLVNVWPDNLYWATPSRNMALTVCEMARAIGARGNGNAQSLMSRLL
jgi:hypothetical protein